MKPRNVLAKVGETILHVFVFCLCCVLVMYYTCSTILFLYFILFWCFCVVDSSDEDKGDTEALLDELLGSGKNPSHRRAAPSARAR